MSNTKTVVKRKRGDWQIAVLFLLPSLILLGLFVFWPMIDSIRMSFYDWNPLKGKIFTGLENYQNLLKDKLWWTSLGNTIKYILGALDDLARLRRHDHGRRRSSGRGRPRGHDREVQGQLHPCR